MGRLKYKRSPTIAFRWRLSAGRPYSGWDCSPRPRRRSFLLWDEFILQPKLIFHASTSTCHSGSRCRSKAALSGFQSPSAFLVSAECQAMVTVYAGAYAFINNPFCSFSGRRCVRDAPALGSIESGCIKNTAARADSSNTFCTVNFRIVCQRAGCREGCSTLVRMVLPSR